MATLSVRLPASIHAKLVELAEQEGTSINQLINSAVAEKIAALMTEEYLTRRAERATRKKFDAVLAKIPRGAPAPGDELPAGYKQRRARKSA